MPVRACLYLTIFCAVFMTCLTQTNSFDPQQTNGVKLFVNFVQSQRSIAKLNILCHWPHSLIKQLWIHGKALTLEQPKITPQDHVIFCADDHNPGDFFNMLRTSKRNAVGLSWLVLGSNSSLEAIHQSGEVAISRKVYFVNYETGVIYERYHMNDHIISNPLGNVFEKSNHELLQNLDENFMFRRVNFMGIQFKACGFRIADPLMYYSQEALKSIKWRKDRKGSLIGDATHQMPLGIFSEVMELMKQDLNFTMINYLRKDDNVGYPRFVNGTFVSMNGMIGDLLTGDLDIIMAPVEQVMGRYGMMDFMHGLSSLTMALLVGVNAGSEDREWLTYLMPFQEDLWLLLVLNSVVAVVAIRLVQNIHIYGWKFNIFTTLVNSIGEFWMVFMSYFGKPATVNFWMFVPSTKILLFMIFLSGNLVFMFYKAALTSELSVRRKVLPFTSPEGYYESDYK